MPSGRGGELPPAITRLLIGSTERALRKKHVLVGDERFIELKPGKIERWWVEGRDQPLPPAFRKLDIPQQRGQSSCGYSARRFFFCSARLLMAELEFVWRVESRSGLLDVTLSLPQLATVQWRPTSRADADELASFARRIRAQRDQRLAELPPEARQRRAEQGSELVRWGSLQAAMVEPGRGPRTNIGRYLRAILLDQRDQLDQLKLRLNGGSMDGWNDDEPAVAKVVCQLLARRHFGASGYDLAVSESARKIAATSNPRSPLDADTIEAVIRDALGELDAIPSNMNRSKRLVARVFASSALSTTLRLDQTAADHLVIQSEEAAFQQGWKPPLAG